MHKIASNVSSATAIANKVNKVKIGKPIKVEINKSNISSMKTGKSVNNNMMLDLEDLADCVKEQAGKFPQIAMIIERRDLAVRFESAFK
ncbi:MAG: hypothetical protein LBM02_09575 [Lachnospiraceae bacterium]|jgi:hypothetical protein|nr:hypothetical protein [Lachnospiraceae bacterium]